MATLQDPRKELAQHLLNMFNYLGSSIEIDTVEDALRVIEIVCDFYDCSAVNLVAAAIEGRIVPTNEYVISDTGWQHYKVIDS